MGAPYVGEIRMVGFSWNPNGWAMCNGALMPISENETLFNLIGTMYGGDGQETFALPNLCGRVPIHAGQGPGISYSYQQGETGGVESVTLTTQQTPAHAHTPLASTGSGTSADPTGRTWAASPARQFVAAEPDVTMNAGVINGAGGSQPHENMQPFLCVSFVISLYGVFPSQN